MGEGISPLRLRTVLHKCQHALANNPKEKLTACCDVLDKIESELRAQITDDKGTTDFHRERINAIFTDKTLKFSADNPRVSDESQTFDEHVVRVKDWFAYDGLFGTSEERGLVSLLDRWIRQSGNTYDYIYLLRNERHFSIYKFSDGRAFEPDFVLFLGKANGESLTYQLFIEPKGEHLENEERWKEDFLKEIRAEYRSRTLTENRKHRESKDEHLEDKERREEDSLKETRAEYQSGILTENRKYRVFGVPAFYNASRENDFWSELDETLGHTHPLENQAENATQLLSNLASPQESRSRRQ